jgi:hypothetical protein
MMNEAQQQLQQEISQVLPEGWDVVGVNSSAAAMAGDLNMDGLLLNMEAQDQPQNVGTGKGA